MTPRRSLTHLEREYTLIFPENTQSKMWRFTEPSTVADIQVILPDLDFREWIVIFSAPFNLQIFIQKTFYLNYYYCKLKGVPTSSRSGRNY